MLARRQKSLKTISRNFPKGLQNTRFWFHEDFSISFTFFIYPQRLWCAFQHYFWYHEICIKYLSCRAHVILDQQANSSAHEAGPLLCTTSEMSAAFSRFAATSKRRILTSCRETSGVSSLLLGFSHTCCLLLVNKWKESKNQFSEITSLCCVNHPT